MANLLAYQLNEKATYRTLTKPDIGSRELKHVEVADTKNKTLSLSQALISDSVSKVSKLPVGDKAELLRFLLDSRVVNCNVTLLGTETRGTSAGSVYDELKFVGAARDFDRMFDNVSIQMNTPLLYTRLGDDILLQFNINLASILKNNVYNDLLGKMLEIYIRGAVTQYHISSLLCTTTTLNYPERGEVDIYDATINLMCEVTAGKNKRPTDVNLLKYKRNAEFIRVLTTQETRDEDRGYHRIPYPVFCCMLDTGDVKKLTKHFGETKPSGEFASSDNF